LSGSEYGETKHGKYYIDLTALSRGLPTGDEQLLTYFLDGSRHVYKVDDMGYDKGNRSVIYPIIAGQIGIGCCYREVRHVSSERFIGEIALAVPDIADADGSGDKGFFQGLATKIRNGSTLASRLGTDWSFSRVFSYDSKDEDKVSEKSVKGGGDKNEAIMVTSWRKFKRIPNKALQDDMFANCPNKQKAECRLADQLKTIKPNIEYFQFHSTITQTTL
jgi:hypothetical protein